MIRIRRLGYLCLGVLSTLSITCVAAQADPQDAPSATDGVSCAGPSLVKADGTPWTCTFDDEFDGTELDSTKWQAATTSQTGGGTQKQYCFVNRPDNISVSDGSLNLTARREDTPVWCNRAKDPFEAQYTLGQVGTLGKFSQMYGRFSVRAAFPPSTVRGLQSALWMWPSDPYSSQLVGEVDIAEAYSSVSDRAVPYLHYLLDPTTVSLKTNVNIFTNNYCMINDIGGFHDYTVEWTPTSFTIIYDGQTCLTNNLQVLGTSPFDQPYFLALTQGLGSGKNAFDPAVTQLPATTKIDWVRVWK